MSYKILNQFQFNHGELGEFTGNKNVNNHGSHRARGPPGAW